MMLLAAFIFVIGLLATAALLSRVPLLARQATREVDRPILQEMNPMVHSLDDAIGHLARDFRPRIDGVCFPYSCGGNATAFDNATMALLQHLRATESERGFLLEWRLTCENAADPTTAHVLLSLSDGEMELEARSARLHMSKCYTPQASGSWPHADLSGPLPPTVLGCFPTVQSIATDELGTWSAAGGTGTYSWSAPNATAPTTGSGSLFAAAFHDAGSYAVSLTSGSQTATCTVTVNAPILTCTPATQVVAVDQAASFTASLFGATSFDWSSPDGSPTSGTGDTYDTAYSAPKGETVTVTASGQTATCHVAVAPPSCSPPSQSVTVNETASFSASGGDGTYAWSSPGSNTPTSGSGASYTASWPTWQTVNVTLTSGNQSSACQVTVNPPALICAPSTVVTGVNQSISLNVTGGINVYAWTLPGASPSTSTATHVTATYASSGTYTATVTSGTQTSTCTVLVNPLLVCTPASQAVTVTDSFSVSASGGNGIYAWSSTGTPSSSSLATYTLSFAAAGTDTLTVTSGTQTATCSVTVNDLPTCAPASQTLTVNTAAALTATGGTSGYTWSSPSGSPTSGSGSSYSTTYTSSGTYTITVTSGTHSGTCTVIVTSLKQHPDACTANVGSVAACVTGIAATDASYGVFTEGTVLDNLTASTATKIVGTFSSTGNTCASTGTDTSGNAKGATDNAWACFVSKNDQLSVSGFTAPDQQGKITKVELGYKVVATVDSGNTISNDQVNLLAKVSGTQVAGSSTTTLTLSTTAAWGYADVTGSRSWSWSDLANLALEADANTHNNHIHLNIDALWLRVTIVGVDGRLSISSVPTNTPHTLSVTYKTSGDSFSLQVWSGSAWTTRATLSSASLTTTTYTLSTAEYNSGTPTFRVVDATSGLASPAATLTIDEMVLASG